MSFSAQQDAAATVANEGLSYAVQDYCSPETFGDDPKTEELWRKAALACHELESYLAPFSNELDDRTADIAKLKKENK